ncbi:hypothetical protein JI739_04770 [Ramlibacter sp. AW1]|uniref:Uncharacterized protein n=1 Tax=Ramlibacter aurantiacus TaxID=2801330 RepID=A0A936ZGY4_9BURK|nr:TAXI family TRAP transporter solute-binding subunit [Ramlibacter aurantiacus]MBL0419657.1 hypothetical protein [Ramlibacter aurantiacus]
MSTSPRLERSYHLTFVGDWGQANFHRICSWLCEEFCRRTGDKSRVAIWSIRHGGIEAVDLVQQGEADLCIVTPAMLLPQALTGTGIFQGHAAPNLRALAVLPQNDRMILALDPKLGIRSFEELRQKRPALRIAASRDDGTNFIGHVGRLVMAAHGIDEATLASWGGSYRVGTKPQESLALMLEGQVDAVLQEAIMTPQWHELVESGRAVPLPAEPQAMASLREQHGIGSDVLPAGYWTPLAQPLPAVDFSDFVILVRDDLREEVAHLLTWCLVETRAAIERQYKHLPPHRSPLSYPLLPERMARPPIELHPGARRYYVESGVLAASA